MYVELLLCHYFLGLGVLYLLRFGKPTLFFKNKCFSVEFYIIRRTYNVLSGGVFQKSGALVLKPGFVEAKVGI